jgi:hypothetical protein
MGGAADRSPMRRELTDEEIHLFGVHAAAIHHGVPETAPEYRDMALTDAYRWATWRLRARRWLDRCGVRWFMGAQIAIPIVGLAVTWATGAEHWWAWGMFSR